jgi:Zn-finger nucleic acid-binding protein
MYCPIDGTTLTATSFGSKHLHRCNRCFGCFVAADTFAEVRAASAMQLHSRHRAEHVEVLRSDGKTLDCPCHKQGMQTIFFKGVEIEVCPTCRGIWLDQGELQKISELAQATKVEDLSGIPQEKARNVAGSDSSDSFDVFSGLAEFIVDIVKLVD